MATSRYGKKGSAIKISDVKRELKARHELTQPQVMANLTYLIDRGWIKTVEWLQWYDFHAEPGGVLESDPHQRGSIESLSILSGAHLTLFPAVVQELERRGGGDVLVFGGGIVPDEDAAQLAAVGVARVFTPGATTQEIVAWVREHVRPRTA